MERCGAEGALQHRIAGLRRPAEPISNHGIGPDRETDILETLLAKIDEFDANLAANLIIDG
jgi:hypothetical protein